MVSVPEKLLREWRLVIHMAECEGPPGLPDSVWGRAPTCGLECREITEFLPVAEEPKPTPELIDLWHREAVEYATGDSDYAWQQRYGFIAGRKKAWLESIGWKP